MDLLCEQLNSSLKNIDHEVFKDVIKVTMEVKPIGEQVVIISEINKAILTLETSSGKKRKIKVIVKIEPSSGPAKALAEEFDVFKTETVMYNNILKSMEKLKSEKGDTHNLWADCYYTADNKNFIFQDLCEVGYKEVPTHKFLDYDHTIIVMKGLGKFHGLSMVMNERNMLEKSKLKPYFAGRRPLMLINFHKMYALNLAKTIKDTWGPEWSTTSENLKKLVANPGDSMQDICELFKDKWCVLCHGDFSMRNMLFHYPPDSSKPDNIKFVDFQLCHYGHFALDLVYLLYSSIRPKVRDENMDSFLNTYLDSMRTTCESYGYKGPLPTIEDAKSSLKAMSYFSSINSICCVPFFIASGKKDVQKKADDCMETFGSEEVSDDLLTNQEDIFFTDNEVMEEMKYEINRMKQENII